jgi:putative aldouronate transport system permease protein
MRQPRKLKISQIIINFAFIMYSIVCIGPLLLILSGSFSSEADIATSSGYSFIPKTFTLDAYRFILGNGKEVFWAYYYSIISTVIGTLLGLIIMAALAYPISRRDFKYRNKISFYVYFTMLFNGGMVPLYLVYTQLINLKNSWLALIIPNMIAGFNILLIKGYMTQNVPEAIIESAEIDGASTFRVFFTMIIPLSRPVLATVGLLSGIAYWNDQFRNMLLINDNSVKNLQYELYLIVQQIQNINQNPNVVRSLNGSLPDLTARMAMAIIVVGPIAVLFPFLSKYFVKGLVVGAVKG